MYPLKATWTFCQSYSINLCFKKTFRNKFRGHWNSDECVWMHDRSFGRLYLKARLKFRIKVWLLTPLTSLKVSSQ